MQPPLKRARPNSGSNVTIPQERIVQTAHAVALGRGTPITPTEHLREGHVAFILGRRTTRKRTMQSNVEGLRMMTGLMAAAHATRFTQLASLPFLQCFFEEALGGETIALDLPLGALAPMLAGSGGPVGLLDDAARRLARDPALQALGGGNPGDLNDGTLLNLPDYAKRLGFRGSEAAAVSELHQGILARDYGPFLRGRGGESAIVACTPGNRTLEASDGTLLAPHHVSRNLGDEAAFSALEKLLTDHGITEWRPDGLVKSKFSNVPEDPVADNYIDARDGSLFNEAIQGPAAAASWTGDASASLSTLDKVYVVIVADCWFDEPAAPLLQPGAIDSADKRKEYLALRARALEGGLDATDFARKQAQAYRGQRNDASRLTNFRVMTTTSGQLIHHSRYRPNSGTKEAGTEPTKRLTGASRLGLQLCSRFGEYVVGSHSIGSVLDTSLSRAAIPPGANLQARSGVNTSMAKVCNR